MSTYLPSLLSRSRSAHVLPRQILAFSLLSVALAACGEDPNAADAGRGDGDGEDAGSGGEGGGASSGIGGQGGRSIPCEPRETQLVTIIPDGALATLDVGAAGLAVLTNEETARLLLFAPDGTLMVEHDLGKRWGGAVEMGPAGTLALISVEDEDGWFHLEATAVAPSRELAGGPTILSPLTAIDEFGDTGPVGAGNATIVPLADRFVVLWQRGPGSIGPLIARYVGLDAQPMGEPFTVIDEDLYLYAAWGDESGLAALGTGAHGAPLLARVPLGSSSPEVSQFGMPTWSSWPTLAGDGTGKLCAGVTLDGTVDDMVMMGIDGTAAGAPKPLPYGVGPMQPVGDGRYALIARSVAPPERHLVLLEADATVISDTMLDEGETWGWAAFAQGGSLSLAWSRWIDTPNDPVEIYTRTSCPSVAE